MTLDVELSNFVLEDFTYRGKVLGIHLEICVEEETDTSFYRAIKLLEKLFEESIPRCQESLINSFNQVNGRKIETMNILSICIIENLDTSVTFLNKHVNQGEPITVTFDKNGRQIYLENH